MRVRWSLIVATALFLVASPLSVDTYNTLNQRTFLDLLLKGNPYHYALGTSVEFLGQTWGLDWPYPPLTIALDLAAWMAYRLVGSEPLYQFLFKLPLFLSAVITFFILERLERTCRSEKPRVMWADLYILNPAVLLLGSIAGGFEIIMTMFLLLAYTYYQKSQLVASGLLLGLAIALRL